MKKLYAAVLAVAVACAFMGAAYADSTPKPRPRPATIDQLLIGPAMPTAAPAPMPTPAPAQTPAMTAPSTEPGTDSMAGIVKTVQSVASQALEWVGVVLAALLTGTAGVVSPLIVQFILAKLREKGIEVSATAGPVLQGMMERALIAGAAKLPKDPEGKVPAEFKEVLVHEAIGYVQTHGADTLRRVGVAPDSDAAADGLGVRAEVALADPAVPVNIGAPSSQPKDNPDLALAAVIVPRAPLAPETPQPVVAIDPAPVTLAAMAAQPA